MTAAWEAFTSCDRDSEATVSERTVRELVNDDGRYDWPPEEVHHGVASIMVSSYGDAPGGAFVKVAGPDRASVEACLTLMVDLVQDGGTLAWWLGVPS